MKNLRLRTKLTLIISILAITAMGIAFTGYMYLEHMSERMRLIQTISVKESKLADQLRAEMANVVRGERAAVMSPKDDDSKTYADFSRDAMSRLLEIRSTLSGMLEKNNSEDRRVFEEFNRAFKDFQDNNSKVLELAVMNTNVKADALLTGRLSERLNAFKEAMIVILAQVDREAKEAMKEPAKATALFNRVRAYSDLRSGVLDITRLAAAHISSSGEEMSKIDDQIANWFRDMETRQKRAVDLTPESDKPLVDKSAEILADIRGIVTQISKLSRDDTDNRSVQLSLGPGAKAMNACFAALDSLTRNLDKQLESEITTSRDAAAAAQRMILVGPFIGVAISMMLGLWTVRGVTMPITKGVAASVAMAKGDLTQRVKLDQQDEVGQLAQAIDEAADAFSKVVCEIRGLSGQIATSAADLGTVSNQLLAQSEEMSTQANHVAGSTGQMTTNINTMAAAAEQMSTNVASISTASEEISVNVGTISSASEQTSRALHSVVISVKQATEAFEGIAREAREGANVTGQAMTMALRATETMNTLDRAAGEITRVTEVIKMIALQTNLLALNATIEATSAGEAGKGFAVVAHEIKELANQSGRAAEEIARQIEGVQSSTRDAVGVIRNVVDVINNINASAGRISEAVERQTRSAQASAASLNEASERVEQIAHSISEVAQGANDMSRNASEAAQGATDVSRNASEAASGVREISQNITGVSQATRDSTQSAQKVADSARRLSVIAHDLQKLVGQFRTA